MRRITPLLLGISLTLGTAAGALALEGKWTPQQVLQLDPQWLKKQGLELPPSRLWDPKRGTGLLAATISTGGCSGGFISPDGLFITNHHCLFSVLQEHATPENDLITNGFLAHTRADELRSGTTRITIPRRFTDVTKEVQAAVPNDASDADRNRAIERKMNELVTTCEKQPSARCRVASFDGGYQYVLVDALEVGDVRLVYAPARAIGEYGGETDNWMWPRHTGDFAIGRVYLDGKPYRNEFWFPISTKGVAPNDFVMVLGYPGVTYRSLTAAEMTERRDLYFTRRVDLFGEWIHILEETTKGNPAAQIAVADNLKTLDNRFKNAQGQLAGFRRGSIVENQKRRDEEVLAWAAKQPSRKEAAVAYGELQKILDEELQSWEHDFLLSQLSGTSAAPTAYGPKSLFLATTVARSAIERQKPDAERDALYMQRSIGRVNEKMAREQKNYFAPADKQIFASVVRRALALPPGQRIASLDALFTATDAPSIANRIDELYAATKIFDANERAKMLAETPEQLRARKDPLVDLGFALDDELRVYGARKDRWEGALSRLRPQWRGAVLAHAGKPVAPDANSTLRVSFAHVKGYTPRDGVRYTPQTTLAGVVEKHTGEEPFNAPANILDAAAKKNFGPWKDAKLGDVPVDFLADADTTGGNSGSPVVNGRGELVGVNFDRVWENVANDFGYNEAVGRNVNVDVRYLLWILDRVDHAGALLQELGVH
jgi:hypothetical protein